MILNRFGRQMGNLFISLLTAVGDPQIYKVASVGGAATRVTFQGNYNASASVSYDDKKIVVAQGAVTYTECNDGPKFGIYGLEHFIYWFIG